MSGRISQYRYVLANTLTSVVAFGRNLLFIATLGLADLGQVALMQTIVMLVGFIQLGTINGAFLLFAEEEPEQTRRIAAVLNMVLLLFSLLVALFALLGRGTALLPVVDPQTLIIGVFAGLATLASTWMNNLLIAKKALAQSNIINIAAVAVSLAAAVLSMRWGLTAALISIMVQPLTAAIGVLMVEPDARLFGIRPDLATLRSIARKGATPFLSMISVLMTYQIERWSIGLLLGADKLGQFYLVMMFTTFFQLVPAALLNVHIPSAVQAVGSDRLRHVLRLHRYEILAYCGLVLLAVLIIAPMAVRILAPKFESSTPLLLLACPALMITALRDNATLALYAERRMRPLLISGVILLASYSVLLGTAAQTGQFSLEAVVLLRGAAAAMSAVYLFWAYRIKVLKGA